MPRKFGQEQALTVLFIGVIAFLFVFQARVTFQNNHRLSFVFEKMNLAYGYASSSLLSSASSSSSSVFSIASSSSSVGVEAGHCADGIDNDGDTLIDCADPDCSGDAACIVSSSSSSSSLACGSDSGANQALLYQGHCYLLYKSSRKTWANAKIACAAYHTSYLASITASAENTALAALTFGTGSWVGLNDQTMEGTYVWDHGDAYSYTNWMAAQPDNAGNQDCTALRTARQWDDLACTLPLDYLCEYPVTATCGDGQKELTEQCDDGNTTSGDGCSASCTTESGWSCTGSLPTTCSQVCGNGIKTAGEQCDDGNTTSSDGCSASCTIESGWSCTGTAPTSCSEVCGNGIVTPGEQCDDGNTSNGDGCSASCRLQTGWYCSGSPSSCHTTCGDGIVAGSEICDDGNNINTDSCTNTCTLATCGDGIIQAGEQCDDSGESASCNTNCHLSVCGDQYVNHAAGETCDDGNNSNLDGCLNSCVLASCGDGYLRTGVEDCEPPGSGTCGGSCQEVRGIGNVTETVASSASSRSLTPAEAHCGNNTIDTQYGETCDDGRLNGLTPNCNKQCQQTFCGDGKVGPGEECEPVRQSDGTFTAQTCGGRECTIPVCNDDGTCFGGCHWQFLPACMDMTSSSQDFFPVNQSFITVPPWFSLVGASSQSSASVSFGEMSFGSSSSSFVMVPQIPQPPFSIGLPGSSGSEQSASAIISSCGNGIREGNEQCDDGSRNSDTLSDACRTNCTLSHCGDGVKDLGEECDDGNKILGDGCTPQCTRSTCGNGVLEAGEECDDGAKNSDTKPDSCSTRCLLPRCGDGVLDAAFGEQCDQGLDNSNTMADRCRLNCIRPHCGDGIVDQGEQCDDGNHSNLDSCSNNCTIIGCGNGIKDWNEQCDDGNKVSGDGCSSICLVEPVSFWQWLNKAVRLPFGW